ncbi:filamentous hemagglutinin family protein [Microbacteriaceae bacterium K1510]|nr:filamentous hemagglutinin family protein [Microbacteriaceae bacterium K1510]
MSVRPAAAYLRSQRHNAGRGALLAGVSILALLVNAVPAKARPLGYGASNSAASAAAVAAAQAASQEAARVAQSAQSALKRATLAVQARQATQQAARDAARAALSTVTDGLSAGGLVVDPRVAAGDTSLWQNISPPSQTTTGGQTMVTLTQSAKRAIATWQQFNVGKNTTVYFDQRGGNSTNGNSWVALNRIDATGSPSQIQGQIKAEGTVLLINPNGIIFTGSSQINVHTLIAASMDFNGIFGGLYNASAFKQLGDAYVPVKVNGVVQTAPNGTLILGPSDEANANKTFLANGLFVNSYISTVVNGSTETTGNTMVLSAGLVPGQNNSGVQVQAGASITTDISGYDNGGFVALLGPQVTNAGTIKTSAGQIILAASSNVQIAEPLANSTQTVYAVKTGDSIGSSYNPLIYVPPAVSGARVLNDTDGILVSQRGNITAVGDIVEQRGFLEATTSITRAGSIIIAANAGPTGSQVVFGPESVTMILPDENGETIPSDSASLATFKGPRIDVYGSYVDFKSGSWVWAPSATMSVSGAMVPGMPDGSPLPPVGRMLMETGSVIDLSGLSVTRSVTDYLYTFKVTANDVADTPLAKSLIGKTVTIDLTLTGTRADGETWVGSPLFASSGAGYLANISQGIDQLLTKGGSLTFGAAKGAGDNLTTSPFVDALFAPGSTINVAGGVIQYTGGRISTSRVLSADGRSYDIGKANPFIQYAGVDQGFTRGNAHWGISQTWSNPLRRNSYYKPSYVNGISAGGIAVTAVNPILEGDLLGKIIIGTNQRALAQAGTGTGGSQATPDQLPSGTSLSITLVANGGIGRTNDVALVSSTPSVLSSDFSFDSSLVLPTTADGQSAISYSTDRLSAFRLGSITISGAETLSLAEGAALSVRDGGSIKLTGATTIDGTLTARGGSITIGGVPARLWESTLPALTLGTHAVLDASGRWVNDSGSEFTGALYINGGSVSLSTFNLSKQTSFDGAAWIVTAEDRSASIVLKEGSIIDVSGGGYVGPNGKLATGSDGLPKGKGGNLSLQTYTGTWMGNTRVDPSYWQSGAVTYAPQTATNANVVMDGTIYAGGFSQGGTFTLQVPEIVIDGQATKVTSITTGADAGTVVLPTSFFTDSGFGSFKLASTYGSTTVTAGTTLILRQQNYVTTPSTSLPATGARVRDFVSLGYALDGMRHAVDLTLSQNPYQWGVAEDRSATAKLLIDEAVRIVADPLANISLNAGGPAIVLGSIKAPGGSIAVNEGFTPATPLDQHDGLPQYLWLGENAVLDVSGAFVRDPRVATYVTGAVLPGGSITLSGLGTIIAFPGAAFDIAGASGTVEVPSRGTGLGGGTQTATRQVWSNGGNLTLSTYDSVYFAGTIKAAGGAPQAAGGTLNISNLGGIVVSQSGDVAAPFVGATPATRAQLQALRPATASISFITADTINTVNSGLDTVSFAGPLYFSGNVNVKIAGSLLIDNQLKTTTLLPEGVTDTTYSVPTCALAGSCIPSIGGTNVTLEAGYIRFYNAKNNNPALPTLADGTLTLKASQGIDLVGIPVVNNAGTVNVISGGDIRMTGTVNFGDTSSYGINWTSNGYGGMPWVGAFLVADNLNMTARAIYPTTDTAFLLMSLGLAPSSVSGTHNTIAFASNGQTPVTPLSAGGAILVDARTIVQGGALYAPLGTIQLGFGAGQTLPSIFINGTTNNPYDPLQTAGYNGIFQIATITTDNVTLLPGSVTSVSANGVTIPYGTTTDGTDWTDNGTLLNGPPSKLVVLGGIKVETQAGAVIDGRGGGEVYATEFVPGTGGSRNVLTTTTQTVYALVPSYNSSLAAYDPSFTTTVSAGQTVTIPGGNGIPAGTYTLLPAQYATVPGAYRVVVVSTNTNPGTATSVVNPDGSVYMTGVFGNAINGSRSSQTALLQIQSNDVWTKYSEIDITKGASYFTALAANKGTATPRLAQDAARLVVTAGTSLVLNAINRFAPADGGLGGQLDITGENLVVAASDKLGNFGTLANGTFTPDAAYTGYLFVDADMLSRLGIESTLIGGYRSTTAEGTRITATALNLEIATNAAHPLTGPDLLFSALAPTAASADVRGIIVNSGSVIEARGTIAGSSSSALVFGADPVATQDSNTGVITGWSDGVTGDGALLRVSNGGLANVVRHFVPGVYQVPSTTPAPTAPVSTVALGSLSVGAGVALSGTTLTLDSTGTTTVATDASLTAKNYDLSGSVINLGGGSGGLVVTTGLIGKFAGADNVRLRSASVVNVYGNNTFGDAGYSIGTLTLDGAGLYSDGGATTITAKDIVLTNTQTTANLAGANTGGSGGSLVLNASDMLIFGAGTKTLSGFAGVTGAAGSGMLFSSSGSLDAKAAAVSLTAPLFLVDAATSQSLTTTGALTLAQGAGTTPAINPTILGGILSLTGGSIDVSGTLAAPGGTLTLEATTGNLTLSDNALLTAAGTRISIGDLIQDTPAGNIRLYADAGNLILGSGTTVDVSAAGSGYAGSLSLYAGGTAGLYGALKGAARYNDIGGEFALIANRLDSGLPLTAGFTRSFQVSLGQGDLVIGTGQTLTSENVLLVANTGGVFVDGTIDASAASGGTIALYGGGASTAAAGTAGASGVTIGANARLYTRYRAPDVNSPGYAKGNAVLVQRGGTITLGTTGTPDGTLNSTYGYQNIQGSGAITVAAGAIFDVSGGAGGNDIDNTGGSVVIRAPILTNNAINVSFNGTVVTSAKADGSASGNPLVANAFAVWSTTDASTDPNKHFDGIIDPAGFFDASGTRIISADANGLYPNSTPASPANGAYLPHVNFYQTTLLDFVNNPFDTNAVAASFAGAQLQVGGNMMVLPSSALHLRPEIDLVNPSTSINGGNIIVASNWNFGAGSIDSGGNIDLLYRTANGGEPGTLTLRAANNVKINATITDGFFADYASGTIATDAGALYASEVSSSLYQSYLGMFSGGVLQYNSSGVRTLISLNPTFVTRNPPLPAGAVGVSASFFNLQQSVFNSLQFQLQAPTILTCGGVCADDVIDQYNQYYAQYVRMFNAYATDIVALNSAALLGRVGTVAPNQTTGPALLSYIDYVAFITKARNIAATLVSFINPTRSNYVPLFTPPTAPTTSTSYYNLSTGTGPLTYSNINTGKGYTTTASDYVTKWTAYFFTVANANIFNTTGAINASVPNAVGSGVTPTLENVAGLSARYGIFAAMAVTPPYAPPAYTSLQPGYVSSMPTPSPVDQIANNPRGFNSASGITPIYNTTSSANLMTAMVSGNGSFSYDFVGGALFNSNGASSVNPNAVVQLSSLSSTVTGDVSVDGHTSYTNPLEKLTVNVPTLVRTGTGSITIAAARDFALLDTVAPGAVYTAGTVADNAAGFTAPTAPTTTANSGLYTKPAWTKDGGDIAVTAGRDIVGIETPTDPGNQYSINGASQGVSTGQFWSAWYYVNGNSTGSATAPFDPSAGGVQYSSWINYGTFFQGFGALGGGNISLEAGHNVKDVSASLPETVQVTGGQSASGPAATARYFGGGNLLVKAGNDVLSGVYYVGRGTGLIRAGGNVVSDATLYQTVYSSGALGTVQWNGQQTQFSVPLLLAVQDSTISVQAAGSIDLGGIFQPTRLPADLRKNLLSDSYDAAAAARTLPSAIGAAFDSYGANSGVALSSSTGSIAIDTLNQDDNNGYAYTLFTHTTSGYGYSVGASSGNIIAPNLSVTALTGDIQVASPYSQNFIYLYPSAVGQLSLIAGGSINGRAPLSNGTNNTVTVRMYDLGDSGRPMLGSQPAALTAPLHTGDDVPALIYAGEDIDNGSYTLLKQARVWAGRDIANVTFTGMNTSDDDITSIVAGRDIYAKRRLDVIGQTRDGTNSVFTLYGPGNFVMAAGRNLGPFTTYTADMINRNPQFNFSGGIFVVGDGSDSALPPKPYLPQKGANITLRYGVAGGIDYAAAIAAYGDAAKATASGTDFVSAVIPQLEQLLKQLIVAQAQAAGITNPSVTVTLTPTEAADIFKALPTAAINDKLATLASKAGLNGLAFNLTPVQFVSLLQRQEAIKLTIDSGFLALLKQVGLDYNDPSSRYYSKYARAYEAIATVFPASAGYTDNSNGGSGEIPALKHTGDLRMARSLVETQTGGDISIIGPGGNAYVGSNSADTLLPSQQGILTLRGGSVRSYTDGSVLIYQSRVFTEQGGDIEMFSANGDLNAGKGPKSSAAYPPLKLICDVDGYCRVSPAGLVTGAGIGALLSVPGQDPTKSNVVLTAPHGTIDAGAAGIRVAGNATFTALQILNAFNIQVNGLSVGLPTVASPNIGALTTASNAAGAASQTAAAPQTDTARQPSVIIVEVVGFGGEGGEQPAHEREPQRRSEGLTPDPHDRVQILDAGALTSARRRELVNERRQLVGR